MGQRNAIRPKNKVFINEIGPDQSIISEAKSRKSGQNSRRILSKTLL
jgi:hypothetical protein